MSKDTYNYENLLSKIIDQDAFNLGISHASYLAGFGFGLKEVTELPDQIIGLIVANKMTLEYQQEIRRMELESREHIIERELEKINIYGDEE